MAANDGWEPGDPLPPTVGGFKQLVLQLLEDADMHWAAHRKSDYNFSNLAQHHPIRVIKSIPIPPHNPVIPLPGSGGITFDEPPVEGNFIYNVILSCYNNTENLNSDERILVTAHDTAGDRFGISIVASTSASVFAVLGIVGVTPTTTSITIETINIVPGLGTVVGGAIFYVPSDRPTHAVSGAGPSPDTSNISPYSHTYVLGNPLIDATVTQSWILNLDSHGLHSGGSIADAHTVVVGLIDVIDHLGSLGKTPTVIGFNLEGAAISDGVAGVVTASGLGFGVISYGLAGL